MKVVVNGVRRNLVEGARLRDAVRASGAPDEARGIAAALDGEVVPRARWSEVTLHDGQRVEVVRAVQGG